MGVEDPKTLYDTDFYTWTQDQAARLRAMAGDNRLDIEHLADEVADLGRSELNKVANHLRQMLTHLLLAAWLPEAPPAREWRGEALNHQIQAVRTFTPGMRQHLDLDEIWTDAIGLANTKLRDHANPGLPANPPCPLTLDEILKTTASIEGLRDSIAAVLAPGNDGSRIG